MSGPGLDQGHRCWLGVRYPGVEWGWLGYPVLGECWVTEGGAGSLRLGWGSLRMR